LPDRARPHRRQGRDRAGVPELAAVGGRRAGVRAAGGARARARAAAGDLRAPDPALPRARPDLRRDQAVGGIMASIRLERLTKDFGGLVAVDDVSLTIPDGEFVALLGPSGCGKTTTMNMISGLERPTSGELWFDDRPMSRVPVGARNVGFVFQNYAIFTHMSVYDNLAFGLRVRRPRPPKPIVDEKVQRVAGVVGVEGLLERRAARLSVNDMQKVALGRSMIVEPSIFLLDEPFSNLDAAFRA